MDMLSSSQGTVVSSGDESSKESHDAGVAVSGLDVALELRDEDFSKDNVASPIDLECHIQEERITKILNEAIYKTKLAICLPKLVQNYTILSNTLSTSHMEDLTFIFEQYDSPLFCGSMLNMAVMEDIKNGDLSIKNRLNPELCHLLNILHSYPSLKESVENMIEQMKSDYLIKGGVTPELEYLIALERFRDITVKQMHTTAADELAEKLELKKLEASNKKLQAKTKVLTDKLQSEQEVFEKELAGKEAEIQKLENELVTLNQAAAAKIHKKVFDSNRQMVVISRANAVRHEVLKEEEHETREAYKQLLQRHLREEKGQRARRFKVETQLLSWVQKYDTEMTDKQYELDEMERQYEEEEKMCRELTARLAEQELQYHPLIKERDDEYHEEMRKKMEAFRIEHAARVIQSAWRRVLANRAEKKKLRATLKAMKKEQNRLQKIADTKLKKEAEEAAKAAKEAKKKQQED